ALAVRNELRDTGVTITTLMPGPTETELFDRAQMRDTRVGSYDGKDDPKDVAREAYDALMNGQEKVVTGPLTNKLLAYGGQFLPGRAKPTGRRLVARHRG